ncbi:MAG: DUF445 domain-containing protein [Chitinophagaceae bacterium]|nr:DUF445 domain-containing protein [Chitinophagaceae bacterium]
MIWVECILLIVIPVFCSWLTSRIVIKILFYPQQPVKIFGTTLQGVFPKKKQLLAQKLAQWLRSKFISYSEIEQRITDPKNFQQLKPDIEKHIDNFLRNKLKDVFPMIAAFIGDKTINQLKQAFLNELETLFPVLIKSYIDNLKDKLDIEKIITEKLNNITLHEIEANFNTHAKKRLQYVAILFGTLTGIIQIIAKIIFITSAS